MMTLSSPTAVATSNAGSTHNIGLSGFSDNNYNLTPESDQQQNSDDRSRRIDVESRECIKKDTDSQTLFFLWD